MKQDVTKPAELHVEVRSTQCIDIGVRGNPSPLSHMLTYKITLNLLVREGRLDYHNSFKPRVLIYLLMKPIIEVPS